MKGWIGMSYDEQLRIIALIDRLTASQNDDEIRAGLDAAIAELMIWSKSPPIVAYEEEDEL